MAQPQTLAIVDTPNPTGLQSISFASAPITTNPLAPNVEQPRELADITIDPKGKWIPSVFQNMLTGLYIPIMFNMNTGSKQYSRKSFPVQSKTPFNMRFPISTERKTSDVGPADSKTPQAIKYVVPQATFSLNPEQNKDFFDDMQLVETKIQEFLSTNMKTLKEQRKAAKKIQANGKAVTVDKKDDIDPVYHSFIKSTTKENPITNEQTTFHNLYLPIHDDAYRLAFCKKYNLPEKESKRSNDGDEPRKVPMIMFTSETYQNGQLIIKRDVKGRPVDGQGKDISVQDLIDQQIKQTWALPTIGFGKLYWFFKDNTISIRMYMNSCIFIEKPQFKRDRCENALGAQFSYSEFSSPKRQRTDNGTSTVTVVIGSEGRESQPSVPPPPFIPTTVLTDEEMVPRNIQQEDGLDLTNV